MTTLRTEVLPTCLDAGGSDAFTSFRPLGTFAELPILIDVPIGTGAAGCRIAVADDLDRSSAPSLERAVIQVLRQHRPDQLELDLTGVAFVDAGGIRALLQCGLDAQQCGCRLTLTHVQPWVYQILEIAGLPNLFEVRTL